MRLLYALPFLAYSLCWASSSVAVFDYYNGGWDIFAAKVSFLQWVRYLPVVESGK